MAWESVSGRLPVVCPLEVCPPVVFPLGVGPLTEACVMVVADSEVVYEVEDSRRRSILLPSRCCNERWLRSAQLMGRRRSP